MLILLDRTYKMQIDNTTVKGENKMFIKRDNLLNKIIKRDEVSIKNALLKHRYGEHVISYGIQSDKFDEYLLQDTPNGYFDLEPREDGLLASNVIETEQGNIEYSVHVENNTDVKVSSFVNFNDLIEDSNVSSAQILLETLIRVHILADYDASRLVAYKEAINKKAQSMFVCEEGYDFVNWYLSKFSLQLSDEGELFDHGSSYDEPQQSYDYDYDEEDIFDVFADDNEEDELVDIELDKEQQKSEEVVTGTIINVGDSKVVVGEPDITQEERRAQEAEKLEQETIDKTFEYFDTFKQFVEDDLLLKIMTYGDNDHELLYAAPKFGEDDVPVIESVSARLSMMYAIHLIKTGKALAEEPRVWYHKNLAPLLAAGFSHITNFAQNGLDTKPYEAMLVNNWVINGKFKEQILSFFIWFVNNEDIQLSQLVGDKPLHDLDIRANFDKEDIGRVVIDTCGNARKNVKGVALFVNSGVKDDVVQLHAINSTGNENDLIKQVILELTPNAISFVTLVWNKKSARLDRHNSAGVNRNDISMVVSLRQILTQLTFAIGIE